MTYKPEIFLSNQCAALSPDNEKTKQKLPQISILDLLKKFQCEDFVAIFLRKLKLREKN